MSFLPSSLRSLRWTLLAAAILGYLSALPYALELQSAQLEELPVPIPLVIVGQLTVAALVYFGVISLALRLLPLTPYRLLIDPREPAREEVGPWRQVVLSGLIGALVAFSGLAIADWGLELLLGALPQPDVPPPIAWKGALAALYGGITEELLLRLFVMTGATALMLRVPAFRRHMTLVVWIAILLSSLVFALGHLPAMLSLDAPVSAQLILRLLFLNSIAGVVFGYLFARRGFESAVLAHALTDILLHAVVPAFG